MLNKIFKKAHSVFVDLISPVVAFLGIPWPEAYRCMGYRHFNAYKILRFISDAGPDQVRQAQIKVIDCFERYVSFDPPIHRVSDWIDANFRISSTLLAIPDTESIAKASMVGRRVEKLIQNIPTKYSVPDSGVAFIPRPLAEGSLGVYENLESYLKAMALGWVPAKRVYFLVEPQTKINNPCYLKYWGKHVEVVRNEKQIKALQEQEQYLTVPMLGIFKQYNQRSLLMHIALGAVREEWIQQKRQPLLMISAQDKERGWDSLKSLGVPQGVWLVGLHVREPGWRDKNAEVENIRNANIQTYYDAIKSVTDAGGWVIRMGDPVSMTPLPEMSHVIDYAHSKLKSDWMDIFLCSQFRFLIGTGSGVYTVAMAFGVPCVMTNLMPANNIFALTSQDLFLTKLCKTKKDGRYLTFEEIVSPPISIAAHAYKDMGIEVEDNTSDEIKGAVEEMMGRLQGDVKYSQDDESLQMELRSIVKNCASLYGDEDLELYPRMGRDYLRKHAFLLNAKEVQC